MSSEIDPDPNLQKLLLKSLYFENLGTRIQKSLISTVVNGLILPKITVSLHLIDIFQMYWTYPLRNEKGSLSRFINYIWDFEKLDKYWPTRFQNIQTADCMWGYNCLIIKSLLSVYAMLRLSRYCKISDFH